MRTLDLGWLTTLYQVQLFVSTPKSCQSMTQTFITSYMSPKAADAQKATMLLSRVLIFTVSIPRQLLHTRTNFTGSHVTTVSHDLHRLRRKPLEPFFSRLGVSRLWPDLAELMERFSGRIESLKGTGSIVRFDHACSAFAGDVIGRVCWNEKERLLDDPNFSSEWWVLLYQTKNMADMCQSGTTSFMG